MIGPHYVLRPASVYERIFIHDLNSVSWAGDLDVETYQESERLLASTTLTRDGGISCWVLVDPSEDHKILSSCEIIRKNAIVSRAPNDLSDGDAMCRVNTVVAHGVGSVFTPKEHRGKGYASVMLRQLSEALIRGNEEGFSVLYSDIGKKFYAKHGWMPHRSSHLEIPAMHSSAVSGIRYLRPSDVATLCEKDITKIHEELLKPATNLKTRVAFLPDYQTMEWHWTKEELVAPILSFRNSISKNIEIKGAVTSYGKRWIIWSRDFGVKNSQLYILRLVSFPATGSDGGAKEEEELAKLLRVAANEAKAWGLQKVVLWNPNEITARAARRVAGLKTRVVNRETDSLPCLMMHDQGSEEDEVEWIANEKYGWC